MTWDRRAERPTKLPDCAKFKRMWTEGVSGKEIGKAFGVSPTYVSVRAGRYGYPARHTTRGRKSVLDELPPLEIDDSDIDPVACLNLWREALKAQFEGAIRASSERDAARNWVGSPDFYGLCEMAGVDGGYIQSAIRCRVGEGGTA